MCDYSLLDMWPENWIQIVFNLKITSYNCPVDILVNSTVLDHAFESLLNTLETLPQTISAQVPIAFSLYLSTC